jgi:hypothetical protein
MQRAEQAILIQDLPPLPLGAALVSGSLLGGLLVTAIWAQAHRQFLRLQQPALSVTVPRRLNLEHASESEPMLTRVSPLLSGQPNAETTDYSLAAPTAVVLKPVLVSSSAPFEQRKQQLWQRLRAETAWLLQLIERTPLLIWGPQRSGKSTLAKVIAILRKLFVGHAIEVADPQAHRNRWPGCFVVYGSNRNYAAIGDRLMAYYARIAQQQASPTTSIWDEFTSYEGWVDGDYKPYACGFVKSVLSESQAANEFAILLAHGRTQGYLGGSKGTKEAREKGLVEIEAIPEFTDTGRAYPSGRYILANFHKDEMNRVQDYPVLLPDWLQIETLLKGFPELDFSEASSSKDPDPNNPQAWQRFVDEASPDQINNLIAKSWFIKRTFRKAPCQ